MRGLVVGSVGAGFSAMRVTCFGLEPSRFHREQARSQGLGAVADSVFTSTRCGSGGRRPLVLNPATELCHVDRIQPFGGCCAAQRG